MRIPLSPAAGPRLPRTLLFALFMLLGLAGAERAAAQTCVASVQSEPLAGDSTRKKDKDKKPKRRAPKDGATVQAVEPGCETDTYRPSVYISPGTGIQSPSVSVSINWRDNVGLDQYSYWISLNGADVTSSFSYGGTATSASSTGTVTLRPGDNTLVAEIWDQAGNHGTATVTYTSTQPAPTSCPLGQYLATYYAGVDLGGSPIQTACESAVDHNWGDGTASGVVGGDNFSVRWVGRHSFTSGAYQFTVRADDGVRLWVDGQLLIDRWVDQAPTTYTAIRQLTDGEHEVKVEYYERGWGAVARLSWDAMPPRPVAPAPEPVAGPLPSLRETVRAAYWQILEREPSASDLAHRTQLIQDGVWSVSTLVADLMKSGEYEARFVSASGISAGAAVDGVYRHMWDRPATPGEVNQWSSTVSAGGYRTLVDHIQNDWYPREQFGRDAVPGRPVTRWDTRTPLMVAPGHATDASRSLCLSAPAGLGAVYECATLRVAHPLPAIRALNRTRVPTLLYSSEQAHPFPTFGLWITPPAGRPGLVRMEATVYTGRGAPDVVERRRASWVGSEFTPGQTKHVSVSYGAADQPTGVYDYAIRLVAVYDNGVTESWIQRGRFALVNHKDSPFGAGWWLAGLERLDLSPSSNGYREVLWIGGDGSTRLYQQGPLPEHSSFWVAKDPTGAADTLWVSQHYPDASYVRRLPGGGNVFFDAGGRHIATEDRLERHTRFRYEAGRLHSVRVPTAAGSDTSKVPYIFGYDAAGHLNRVSAPDLAGNEARVVYMGPDPSGLVRWIRDPGTPRATDFEYGQNTEWERMTRRVDMRGTVTAFYYDWGAKLATAAVWMGDPAKDIVMRFHNRETRGHTNMGPAVVPGDVATTIDGPRPDADADDRTHFWLDRFGAPWRIVDAGRRETVLTRSDPRFPALVTRTDGPIRLDGRRQTVSATYDARGRTTSSTDWSTSRVLPDGSTAYATTLYEYGNTQWANLEQPTRITSPEGEVTSMGYLPNGNREWQQPGSDQTRRVTFGYNPLGLVETVTLPNTAPERYGYDTRGNLASVLTPRGYLLGFQTTYRNDELGRTWQVERPVDSTRRTRVTTTTFYPGTDRPQTVTTQGAGPDGTTQTVTAEYEYDAEGNTRRVSRRSDPDPNRIDWITTRWDYDPAGRRVAEWAPDATPANLADNPVDSTYYDHAGNAVRVRTRRFAEIAAAPGNTPATAYITMKYDALNRLRSRRTPRVEYGAIESVFKNGAFGLSAAAGALLVPAYPTPGGTGYRIEAARDTFHYDPVGNLVEADNADALVRRTYRLNGALETETQQVQTAARDDATRHVYTLRYEYDLSGRRTELVHPGALAPSPSQNTTRYTYHPLTGAAETVTDALGNQFRFGFNVRGDLESLSMPGGVREWYRYDADGNRTDHQAFRGASALRLTTLNYDWDDRVVSTANTVGTRDTLTSSYTPFGHVRSGQVISHAPDGIWFGCAATSIRFDNGETMLHDALGNLYQTTNSHNTTGRCGNDWANPRISQTLSYHGGTGRLAWTQGELEETREVTQYDAGGNVVRTANVYTRPSNGRVAERVSYYGADDRLRAADDRTGHITNDYGSNYRAAFEEYRYDALGRRVWVRARRYCEKLPSSAYAECTLDKVRRTVWDGDQELYEIQMPGGDNSPYLESDDPPPAGLPRETAEGSGVAADPNPFFGRVAYTYGLGVDRPLSIIRIGYGDQLNQSTDPSYTNQQATPRALAPFAIFPLWNSRGQADLGVFVDGNQRQCVTDAEGAIRCVYLGWPGWWAAYNRPRLGTTFWHGTLLEDKRDDAGTYYRRNRYYDPATSRFTQEDPIGLAGGLNLYGFANGNPVGYSDPYGLSGCDWLRSPGECAARQLFSAMGAAGHPITMTEARYYARHPMTMGFAAIAVQETGAFVSEIEQSAEFGGMPGVANVARHQYGQCAMTMLAGEGAAKTTADLHEAERPQGEADSQVDQENNTRGRALGRAGKRSVLGRDGAQQRQHHCGSGVRDNLRSGNFWYVRKGGGE